MIKKLPLYILLLFFFISPVLFSKDIKTGNWLMELKIAETKTLPVNVTISKTKTGYTFHFINGDEVISATQCYLKNDSISVQMPLFNSAFQLKIDHKKSLSGVWSNYAKGPDYKVPVQFNAKIENRFEQKEVPLFNPEGNWKVVFNHNGTHPWDALGIFKTCKKGTFGTFLTETGDYRYLQGNVSGNTFQVSCFDGSHAFLFEAVFENDTLKGHFYSGNHWSCEWFGVKDQDFKLKDPNKLTHIKENETFSFSAIDSTGNQFNFPNEDYHNKVTIIQIMGSWCPNCMDETVFYKELYNEYNKEGLEIISVGFEAGKTTEIQQAQLDRLKAHFKVNYPVLLGGKADKTVANNVFSSLNHVMSFPTSIFIDKNGDVRKIHTGFNGPGTGSYYKNYVEQTKMLVEQLIKE